MIEKSLCFNDEELAFLALGVEELINKDILNKSYFDFTHEERKLLDKLYKKIMCEIYD